MQIEIEIDDYISFDSFKERKAARAIIKDGDRFLLVRGPEGDLKFPGGGQEKDESLSRTLCREVMEETGYEIADKTVRDFGTVKEVRKKTGTVVMLSHYFTCRVTGKSGAHNGDYTPVWLTLKEAFAVNSGIRDYEKFPWVLRETRVMDYLLHNRYVSIYDDFECIAGECSLTCCKGWKISVDDDTYTEWNASRKKSTFVRDGERIMRLNREGRCPFLNKNNLCDIVAEEGQQKTPDTCRLFPRQINDYDDCREYSLVSCCPHVIDIYRDKAITYNRDNSGDLFLVRDRIFDYFADENNSIVEAALLSFYYLVSDDFDEKELRRALKNISAPEVSTVEECNELFYDLAVNYVKEGLYKDFLLPIFELSDRLQNHGIKGKDIFNFSKEWHNYDSLMRRYLCLEIFSNLYLPDYDKRSMTIALQWIIMEYVTIRQAAFLTWMSEDELSYETIRECITVISRMTGYDEDDIIEYMESMFEDIIFEPAYIVTLIGKI